jgi:hypothetical protein
MKRPQEAALVVRPIAGERGWPTWATQVCPGVSAAAPIGGQHCAGLRTALPTRIGLPGGTRRNAIWAISHRRSRGETAPPPRIFRREHPD